MFKAFSVHGMVHQSLSHTALGTQLESDQLKTLEPDKHKRKAE